MIILFWAQSTLAQTDVQVLLTDNESEFGAEFIEALRFSYDNGLTRFKTIKSFNPYEQLTREQAAKIVGVFASDVMNYEESNSWSCEFRDLEWADKSLTPYIFESCKLWIFRWTSSGDFFPSKGLTKAEAITVIIRMFNQWSLDETGDPRYLNYYLEARKLELTKETNIFALERPLTRYEMILLLYRFHVKYTLLEKLNANVGLFDDSDNISIRSVGNWVIVLNSEELLDEVVKEVYAEIDDKYYRLEKSSLISQFDNAFTWYGDVYGLEDKDDDKWEYIGVATFNLVNWVVSDGNIRLTEVADWYYKIDISDIRPFYTAVKTWEGADSTWETVINLGSTPTVVTTNIPANTQIKPKPDITSCTGLQIKWQCEEIASCIWKPVKCSKDNEIEYWCRADTEENNAIKLSCE